MFLAVGQLVVDQIATNSETMFFCNYADLQLVRCLCFTLLIQSSRMASHSPSPCTVHRLLVGTSCSLCVWLLSVMAEGQRRFAAPAPLEKLPAAPAMR
mmetsp:Transcript_19624/g.45689  ORF Transcript_19624/g.45689 Transcript_19624/m.45689 type:complete len:98 (+) Transcript_19624:61-354(+)